MTSSSPVIRTIGVISDTHGLLRGAVSKAFQDVQLILHAGDVGSEAVLSELNVIAPTVAVRGNTDGGWAARLRETELVTVAGLTVYLLHDLDRLDLNPEAAGVHVVVSGHTHRPDISRKNGVLYLNPGGAGPRRFNYPITVATMALAPDGPKPRVIDIGPSPAFA